MLDVGDGNLMYWEARGNPNGLPVMVVHGGPGGGSPGRMPGVFDPQRHRVLLFDQRGCGRSTPHASDPTTDMTVNTAPHLVRDMEQLREHLGVEQMLLFGASWGSALSLGYAQRHPDRVRGLVLPAFWLMGRAEVDWLYRGGVGRLFPEQWQQFRDGALGERDVVGTYARLLGDPDPDVRARSALAWSRWEDAVLSLEPNGKPDYYSDSASEALLAFARICATYAAHDGWFDDGALMRDAGRLAGVPGVIVHGRHDLSCPVGPAWEFARKWTDCKLVVVEDAGHKGSAEMGQRVRAAVDGFTAAD